MSEAKIVWAVDAEGVARHIMEVESGLDCNCSCPGCKARLEAVNSRNPNWKRRPHFRHHEAPELEDCAQSAVLAGARKALEDATEIKLPAYKVRREVSSPTGKIFAGQADAPEEIVSVEAVEFVDATEAILTLSGGRRVLLRLIATTRRGADPKQAVIGEIVIDVSDPALRTADPESLRKHITLGDSARMWCNHIGDGVLQQRALEAAQRQVELAMASRPTPSVVPVSPMSAPQAPVISQSVSTATPRYNNWVAGRGRNAPSISCQWVDGDPDRSRWGQFLSNWQIMFDGRYAPILDFGLSQKAIGAQAPDTLTAASHEFGFSEAAIRGLWIAAGIVRAVR